jgi:hypothetical protein
MSKGDLPKVTFGIIVLNGEPFTRYCLRALYPFAYEIIVVEGATASASTIATPDGHSTDDTLEVLRRFKDEEDLEDKVQIVVRDDFWREKDEMSQAYADRATGDYLWQVDIDEFYKPEDMDLIMKMLLQDAEITAVSFKIINFWGNLNYVTDGWYLRNGAEIFHRLFKWGTDYSYITHRPPTINNDIGRDVRSIKWIDGYKLAQHGIFLYHYSLLFPKQVQEKCEYYEHVEWLKKRGFQSWANDCFIHLQKPFRVHNVYEYPSWLERFHGTHPPEIMHMWEDIEKDRIKIKIRPNEDVEKLLSSLHYILRRGVIKQQYNVDQFYRRARRVGSIIKRKLFP